MGTAPVSEQLERVARAARLGGAITMLMGTLGVAILVLVAVLAADAGGQLSSVAAVAYLLIMLVLYFVPGSLLWWLGRRLDAGAHWAFVPILVVCVLAFSAILFSRSLSLLVTSTLIRLPIVYVVATWLNGFSEYRDFRRQRRRQAERFARRGFEPVVAASGVMPKPPPPAGGALRPSRSG